MNFLQKVITGHECTKETVLDKPTQKKVVAEKKPIARLGDTTVVHTVSGKNCIDSHVGEILTASTTVLVGGIGIARVDDKCDAGMLTEGSSTVLVGG